MDVYALMRRGWCAWRARGTGHGRLVANNDEMWTHCPRCGYLSPGIVIETVHVRLTWHYDRHRRRFRRAS
jgi:hypothetical protein